MEKSKCYGCDKRYPGCHDHCDTYKEWKEKHDERKAQIQKAKNADSDIRHYKIDRIMKTKKR